MHQCSTIDATAASQEQGMSAGGDAQEAAQKNSSKNLSEEKERVMGKEVRTPLESGNRQPCTEGTDWEFLSHFGNESK